MTLQKTLNPLEQKYVYWNARDWEGAASCYTPDATHTDQTLGYTWSVDEVVAFTKHMYDVVPGLRFEIVDTFATDTHVAAEMIMYGVFQQDMGHVKATGKELAVKYCTYGELVDGKISRMVDYYNKEELAG
jgi:steroid delta-isomerase-like uncharacterized protein